MPASYVKDPADDLDYVVDWTSYLGVGETVSSTTWTISPAGLTKGASTSTSAVATVWLAGGTMGASYTVGCLIVTNQGRTIERSFTVRVENR